MANLTLLSTIISRMNTRSSIEPIEESLKVRWIDEAIREIRRETQLPWTLKKSTLRVFDGVLEYPVESDHDELAFFDNESKSWSRKPRAKYTSHEQFLHDPDNTDDMAEIWDSGTRYIGLRYTKGNGTSSLLDSADSVSGWAGSGDAGTPVLDTVLFKEGNASVRVPITLSTSSATIRNTFTAFSDSKYLKKYHFMWVYLPSLPTTISLRLETGSSHYLATSITTQFSGAPLKAGAWNLIAQDLSAATETGTFDSSSIASQSVVMTGAATGNYYFDASYLREWSLLDFYFYSKYLVATVGNTTANQEYFYNSSEVYSADSSLIGDSEWVDVIQYGAEMNAFADKEDDKNFAKALKKRDMALVALAKNYPSMKPLITTSRYNFETDYLSQYGVTE